MIHTRPHGLISINHAARLYVVECGPKGVSSLGFDYAHGRTAAVASWLNRPDLQPPARRGTIKAYAAYKLAMAEGAAHTARTGEKCDAELDARLKGLEGHRIEVRDSGGGRRRFIVGKWTGWLPCHLEIPRLSSHGGASVMLRPTDHITDLGRAR